MTDDRMIVTEAPIEAVTVHRRGATVTRRTRVAAGDGGLPTRLSVVGLPLATRAPTVQVAVTAVEGTGAVLAGTPRLGLYARPPAETGEAPALAEQRAARRDAEHTRARLSQVDHELQMLGALRIDPRPSPGRGKAPRPSPMDTRLALVEFSDGLTGELHAKRTELVRTLAEQEARMADLADRVTRASRAQVVEQAAITARIDVDLHVTEGAPTAVELTVRYLVPGARWVPAWQVRLDGAGTAARIEMRAHVAQASGEDWTGARLRLSTADPLRFARLPKLKSLRIGKAQGQPPAPRGFRPPPMGAAALFGDYDRARRALDPRAPGATVDPSVSRLHIPAPAPWTPPQSDAGMTTGMAMDGMAEELDEVPMAAFGGAPAPPPAMAAPAMARSMPPPAPRAPSPKRKRAKGRGGERTRSGVAPPGGIGGGGRPTDAVRAAIVFSDLRLPAAHDSGRGTLQAEDRVARWRADLTADGRRLTADPAALVRGADRRARAVEGLALPTGTRGVGDAVGAYDFAWDAEAPVDVPADGGWHSVPVSTREARCTLRYVTVPREAPHVFRLAALENPGGAPLLTGPADVYVDGAYVLSTRLPTVPPGGRFELGLGVEQAIRCARNTRYVEHRSDARVVAMAELKHTIEVELRNGLGRPAAIEVRERIPQPAEGAEVVVEEIGVEPPWQAYDQEERGRPVVGGRRWSVTLEPGSTTQLEATYVVKIYAANELVGGNRREA